MASINISITEEAYRFLKMLKGENKSFSEVILDLKNNGNIIRKGSKEHVLKFWGVLKDVDWNEREKRIKSFKESFNKRMKETQKYMEESRKK